MNKTGSKTLDASTWRRRQIGVYQMKTEQIMNPLPWSKASFGVQPDKTMLGIVSSIENMGAAFPGFARVYAGMFYKKMVAREIALSGITPGMSVLHVGCGPLPMTAIYLARFGARVIAMDSEPAALLQAERSVKREACGSRVKLDSGCGTCIDYSGFDAIWFSLHVHPLERVVRHALETSESHTALVCRVPRGSLARLYKEVDRKAFAEKVEWTEIRQPFGKKSILIKKTSAML